MKGIDEDFVRNQWVPPVDEEPQGGGLPGSPGIPGGPQWGEIIPLGTVQAAPQFPLSAFPEELACFAAELAESLYCPPDFIGLSMLAAVSGAVGASRALLVKNGWTERGAVYAAVVCPPGQTKTAAVEQTISPIRAEDARNCRRHQEAMEKHKIDLDIFEARYKDWKRAPEGERPEEPRKPVLDRVIVSNATTEALRNILSERPRGVLMVKDELIGLVAGMNQYKGGQGDDSQFYLSAWSGASEPVDRAGATGKGPTFVPNPFLSIVGAMTTDKLSSLRGDSGKRKADDDGWIDRFLFAWPEPYPADEERWAEVSVQSRAGWATVLGRLLRLEMVDECQDGMVVGKCPYLLRLDESGREAFTEFTRENAREINDPRFPPHLKGPWAKLRGYCMRISLILHLMDWATCGVEGGHKGDVDGNPVKRAARLVAYFKGMARRVYNAIDRDAAVERARAVLDWMIRRPEDVKKFKAHQVLKDRQSRTLPTIGAVIQGLGLLVEHNFIRPLGAPGPSPKGGRPPATEYEINPQGTTGHTG